MNSLFNSSIKPEKQSKVIYFKSIVCSGCNSWINVSTFSWTAWLNSILVWYKNSNSFIYIYWYRASIDAKDSPLSFNCSIINVCVLIANLFKSVAILHIVCRRGLCFFILLESSIGIAVRQSCNLQHFFFKFRAGSFLFINLIVLIVSKRAVFS